MTIHDEDLGRARRSFRAERDGVECTESRAVTLGHSATPQAWAIRGRIVTRTSNQACVERRERTVTWGRRFACSTSADGEGAASVQMNPCLTIPELG